MSEQQQDPTGPGTGQQQQQQAAIGFAIKFYEIDKNLNKEERHTLGTYFKNISNRTTIGSGLAFACGFGFVFFINRRKIQATAAQVKQLQAAHVPKEEIFKRVPRNKIGVQGTLAGLACMMFGAPIISSVAKSSAFSRLQSQEQQKVDYGIAARSSSGNSNNNDDGSFDNSASFGNENDAGTAGYADGTPKTNVLKMAELLYTFPAFKWAYYFELTSMKPELAVKDPRKFKYRALPNGQVEQVPVESVETLPLQQQQQQQQQYLRVPQSQQQQGPIIPEISSSQPGNRNDSEIPAYKIGSYDNNKYTGNDNVGLEPSSNPFSVPKSSPTPSYQTQSPFATRIEDDDDIGNLGLGGSNDAGSSGSSSQDGGAGSYGSAWDRIRSQNGGSSGGSGPSGSGSYWDEIRRRSN